jgi:hypothetical protein
VNPDCLDVLEFGIGNRAQYQPVFIPPSSPTLNTELDPSVFCWHSLFPVLSRLPHHPRPPSADRPASRATLPSFRRRAGEPRCSPLPPPAGRAASPTSLRRRASPRHPCAPWTADLDDSVARLLFAAELGPLPSIHGCSRSSDGEVAPWSRGVDGRERIDEQIPIFPFALN